MEKNEIKILCIDDLHDNLISLKALIREAFPDAITLMGENGPDGIQLAMSEDPDVILLGVVMPGMDGFEVCQKLKANLKTWDIPVVFITALKGNKQSRIRALEVGAEAFLAKPVDETELTAQIRAMVKIKAANNQKRQEKETLAQRVMEQTQELQHAHTATLLLLEDLRKENETRQQNEVDLQKAKKFLEEAQRISHLGNWEWDLITNQSIWSNELYQIYGRSPEMNTPSIDQWLENIHPDDRISLQNAIQSAMIAGNFQTNYRILRYDNAQIRWIHTEGEVTFVDGKPVSLHGVAQDITERKQAEERLQESELKYKLLFNAIPESVLLIGKDRSVVAANQASARLYGYELPEQLEGLDTRLLIAEKDRERATQIQVDILQGEEMPERRYIEVRRDGSEFVAEVMSTTLHGPQQEVTGYIGITRDITAFVEAGEALKESEERYRLLFKSAGVGIAYYSLDGIIFSYNTIAARHMGGIPEDFAGKSIFDLFPKAAADVYMERIRKAAASESTQEYEDQVDLPGEAKWFVSAFNRILNTSNQVSGVQIISTDISGLKREETHNRLISEIQDILLRPCKLEDIYRLVSEKVAQLIGDGITATAILDENNKSLHMCSYSGLDIPFEKVLSAIGFDPWKKEFSLDAMPEEALRMYRHNKLIILEGGLYTLLTHIIPKPTSRIVEKLLRIKKIYSIGFIHNNEHLGGLAILARSDITPHIATIEQIVNLATIAIERKLAEQKINEQLIELRRWYSAMLGREERTMDLKNEVNELLAQAGQPPRYGASLEETHE